MNVVFRVARKVGTPARPHARLRGHMENIIYIAQELFKIALQKVSPDELKVLPAGQARQIGIFDVPRIVVEKIIDPDDFVAAA
jgi:hypothetical protein